MTTMIVVDAMTGLRRAGMTGTVGAALGMIAAVGVMMIAAAMTTVAVMIVVGVTRGWLVPRPLHREIIDGKNAALTELRERAKVDAETIRLQAQTIADRNAVEDTSIRMLQAFLEATTGSGEG